MQQAPVFSRSYEQNGLIVHLRTIRGFVHGLTQLRLVAAEASTPGAENGRCSHVGSALDSLGARARLPRTRRQANTLNAMALRGLIERKMPPAGIQRGIAVLQASRIASGKFDNKRPPLG
jgi:hypothetical protein